MNLCRSSLISLVGPVEGGFFLFCFVFWFFCCFSLVMVVVVVVCVFCLFDCLFVRPTVCLFV